MAKWLVVGLGNPGQSYADNRHNIGAMVVAELARRGRANWRTHRLLRADLAHVLVGPTGTGAVGPDLERVELARPRSYMNESGGPVKAVLGQAKLRPSHLVVVHDELDLALGQLRVKFGGGDNGHNGLKSIRARLGQGDYYRVRCGVDRPTGRQDVVDWVLSDFGRAQGEARDELVALAADAVEVLISQGLEATQQRFNS
ncbi:MAG: aminoacyl-tRNA hydrolase [Propionibacteriaceae bacterium]|jgi:PTH1 family peptidyl-tRNA hydrolase|nr:aminoacyl-tRNA hydrolase [Propionibacteriaceae bacterium]